MVNSAEFAKRLEKILDFYGITATAFSEAIDVNRSTISHLLSGRNKPSLDFVLKVIQHYPEVELYWLLNGKGTFPSEAESQIKTTHTAEKEKGSYLEPALPKKSPIHELRETPHQNLSKSPEIDRIVVFYKDGSFKSYEN
jgi:transcriptional regulator with XRE-family HTH domain